MRAQALWQSVCLRAAGGAQTPTTSARNKVRFHHTTHNAELHVVRVMGDQRLKYNMAGWQRAKPISQILTKYIHPNLHLSAVYIIDMFPNILLSYLSVCTFYITLMCFSKCLTPGLTARHVSVWVWVFVCVHTVYHQPSSCQSHVVYGTATVKHRQ